MDRTWLAIGSILMFLAVAFGAFGRHALKPRLSLEMLETFEVATRYLVYHALALIAVSLLAPRTGVVVQVAGGLFAVGIVIFSGSLYALALTGTRWLGAVTPIGGLLLLAGWLALVWAAVVARA
jgi:uncharacterized membrane protein YgdD (TMEM256/DUF423 family)